MWNHTHSGLVFSVCWKSDQILYSIYGRLLPLKNHAFAVTWIHYSMKIQSEFNSAAWSRTVKFHSIKYLQTFIFALGNFIASHQLFCQYTAWYYIDSNQHYCELNLHFYFHFLSPAACNIVSFLPITSYFCVLQQNYSQILVFKLWFRLQTEEILPEHSKYITKTYILVTENPSSASLWPLAYGTASDHCCFGAPPLCNP